MDGHAFAVRVKPGAKKDAVGGVWAGPSGDALIVAVAAPAVDGKANDAVLKALAKALGVRARDLSIASGHRGRDKRIVLADATSEQVERIVRLRTS